MKDRDSESVNRSGERVDGSFRSDPDGEVVQSTSHTSATGLDADPSPFSSPSLRLCQSSPLETACSHSPTVYSLSATSPSDLPSRRSPRRSGIRLSNRLPRGRRRSHVPRGPPCNRTSGHSRPVPFEFEGAATRPVPFRNTRRRRDQPRFLVAYHGVSGPYHDRRCRSLLYRLSPRYKAFLRPDNCPPPMLVVFGRVRTMHVVALFVP